MGLSIRCPPLHTGGFTVGSNLCPSCFSRQYEAGRCGKCGFTGAEYKPERTALPLGSIVCSYRIGLMKSNSRQSQVYTAAHNETSTPVIIEEFFPAKVAGRAPNTEEVILAVTDPELTQRFQQACLLIESSTQRRPLKRIETFRANNTVYSVFEPAGTVSTAVQCEMMADNPYYFRDQNGKPMMTINALPIPDMPMERAYDADRYKNEGPNTQAADEKDRHPQTVIEEATNRKRKQKYIRIGCIAAALVVLITATAVVLSNRDRRTENNPAEQTILPDVVQTPEPAPAVPDATTGSGADMEPTEAGSNSEEKVPTEEEKETAEEAEIPDEDGKDTPEEAEVPAEEKKDSSEGAEPPAEEKKDSPEGAEIPVEEKRESSKGAEAPSEDKKGNSEGAESPTEDKMGSPEGAESPAEEKKGNPEGSEVPAEERKGPAEEAEALTGEEKKLAEPAFLRKDEFIERLQVAVADTAKEYGGTKLRSSAKTVDHTASGKPVSFSINRQVILFGRKIIQKSTKTGYRNKVYVVIEHEDIDSNERPIVNRYRVPIFQYDTNSESYSVTEGAVLSFETWTDLGKDIPEGTRIYFPRESAGELEKNLDKWLDWKDVKIYLKEETGQIRLLFAKDDENPPEGITVCVYGGRAKPSKETDAVTKDAVLTETHEPAEAPPDPSEPEETIPDKPMSFPIPTPTPEPEEDGPVFPDLTDGQKPTNGESTSSPGMDTDSWEKVLPSESDFKCIADEDGKIYSIKDFRTSDKVKIIKIKASEDQEAIELIRKQSSPGQVVWSFPEGVALLPGKYTFEFYESENGEPERKAYSLTGATQS